MKLDKLEGLTGLTVKLGDTPNVRADARWSPVVVQGGGARVPKTKTKPAGS